MRLLPKSLFGQIVLALVSGLVVAHVVGAWLMLDDPEQSLDSRARLGLADALRDLSARLPVIVATFDGPFADALRSARGARGCRLTRDAGGHRLQELDS